MVDQNGLPDTFQDRDFNSGLRLSFWRQRRVKVLTRLVSLLITLTFVFPYLTWAFESSTFADPEKIVEFSGRPVEIPGELGTVTHTHIRPGRMVIYVQDLHCNAEVQRHIAGLIGHLAGTHDLRLAGIEGASGWVDVDVLGSFPEEQVRRAAAE